MRLEDYFEVVSANDIRLKGHRIGIETILFEYLDGITPEEILAHYPTLTPEEVYATITYYWRNQEMLRAYLDEARRHEEEMLRAQEISPPAAVVRLRQVAKKAHREREDRMDIAA